MNSFGFKKFMGLAFIAFTLIGLGQYLQEFFPEFSPFLFYGGLGGFLMFLGLATMLVPKGLMKKAFKEPKEEVPESKQINSLSFNSDANIFLLIIFFVALVGFLGVLVSFNNNYPEIAPGFESSLAFTVFFWSGLAIVLGILK